MLRCVFPAIPARFHQSNWESVVFGLADYALWMGEFCLEFLGAWLCFKVSSSGGVEGHTELRRYGRGLLRTCEQPVRIADALSKGCAALPSENQASPTTGINILGYLLAFRASADALTFILKVSGDSSGLWAAWKWADYSQHMIQYVLLAILAMKCLGASVGADPRTVRAYGSLAAVVGILGILFAHGANPWTAYALLQIGSRADFILAVLVGSVLLFREWEVIVTPMEKPWLLISWGLLFAVSSDGLFRELLSHGKISGLAASRLLAGGQLVALSVWAWAVWNKPEAAQEVRPGIGQQVPGMVLDSSTEGSVN
jgi:hypothetical protein